MPSMGEHSVSVRHGKKVGVMKVFHSLIIYVEIIEAVFVPN